MLFIIDMQNKYVDPKSEEYIAGADRMIPGIIKKIKEYEDKKDKVFYTTDIYAEAESSNDDTIEHSNDSKDIERKFQKATDEEVKGFMLPDSLFSRLKNHPNIMKSYYAIPPEKLLELQREHKYQENIIKEIEVLGVETNVCVLANAICIQSAFPDSTIVINASLSKSKDEKAGQSALDIMESLGMKIRR